MVQIAIRNVNYSYERVLAVDNVSFDINEGEYLCIVGCNGSGKSTLLKGILGLISPVSGKIEFNNISPDNIGYLPQNSSFDKKFPATVKEVISMGTQKSGKLFFSISDSYTVQNIMSQLGITELANKKIGDLSGGQLQRVLLARAFSRNPKILILDEPCAGLDPEITKEFYNIIYDMNKNKNITIIMTSHDLADVEKYATRVVKMDKSVIFDGSIEQWVSKDLPKETCHCCHSVEGMVNNNV